MWLYIVAESDPAKKNINVLNIHLFSFLLGGGWTNPFETYARQIGSFHIIFPRDRGENKKHIYMYIYMGVSENSGTPKMDGL